MKTKLLYFTMFLCVIFTMDAVIAQELSLEAGEIIRDLKQDRWIEPVIWKVGLWNCAGIQLTDSAMYVISGRRIRTKKFDDPDSVVQVSGLAFASNISVECFNNKYFLFTSVYDWQARTTSVYHLDIHQKNLKESKIFEEKSLFDDVLMSLGTDSGMRLFISGRELYTAYTATPSDATSWQLLKITGTGVPGSFKQVRPFYLDAGYWNGIELAAYSGGDNIGYSFRSDSTWYTQLFRDAPSVLSSNDFRPEPQQLCITNDGTEMRIAYRTASDPTMLTILYNQTGLTAKNGWIDVGDEWQLEQFEFPKSIVAISSNDNIVAIATIKNVYVLPVNRFRQNLGRPVILPIPIAYRGWRYYNSYVTGIAVNGNNDVAVCYKEGNKAPAEADHTGYVALYRKIPRLTPVNGNGDDVKKPDNFCLEQNYPNPFNPKTTISFTVPAGRVTINIFNSTGQMVITLLDQHMTAGNHNIQFVANNLASGIYIYRITVIGDSREQLQSVKKMILIN